MRDPIELFTPAEFAAQAQAALDRARARFGHDVFRMEADDGDDGSGDDGDDGSGDDGDDGSGDDGDDGQIELEKLPASVQKLVKRYQREAAEASGKAREDARSKAANEARDAVMAEIGQKLGFIKGDDKLTPEEFEKRLKESGGETEQARSEANQTKVELAVYRLAGKANGDPEALLDSRMFLKAVGKLDPAAEDFNTKVQAAIKDAVKDNEKLRASRVGARTSGTDGGSGGSGDTKTDKPKGLAASLGEHYGT